MEKSSTTLRIGDGLFHSNKKKYLNQKFKRYDEYFNYYNKNGEPDQSPSEHGSQSLEDSKRRAYVASEGQEADDEKGTLMKIAKGNVIK